MFKTELNKLSYFTLKFADPIAQAIKDGSVDEAVVVENDQDELDDQIAGLRVRVEENELEFVTILPPDYSEGPGFATVNISLDGNKAAKAHKETQLNVENEENFTAQTECKDSIDGIVTLSVQDMSEGGSIAEFTYEFEVPLPDVDCEPQLTEKAEEASQKYEAKAWQNVKER